MYSTWNNQIPWMNNIDDLTYQLLSLKSNSQQQIQMTGPLLSNYTSQYAEYGKGTDTKAPVGRAMYPAGPVDFYAVLDFECTCERSVRSYQHEIIEFPVVFLNARTLEVEMEFRRFVRPTEKPMLSAFCTELTGIEQSSTDKADTLDVVLREFEKFLSDHGLKGQGAERAENATRTFAIATDGPWDVLAFLRKECQRKALPLQPYWSHFVDVRHWFAAGFNVRRCGPTKMLEQCGLEFQGREHSGIDDARNIARIAAEMIRAGRPLVSESWHNRAYLPNNIY
jgi:3'-5' exoribonuclease 1